MPPVEDRIVAAAEAHTDLNTFVAIVSILEGGTVYTASGKCTAAKIISLCQAESQKQIKVYDRALDRAFPHNRETSRPEE
jgi:hypothetical protein